MDRNKTLLIPHIAELDGCLSPDDAIALLEARAPRRIINSVNWQREYPYRPLSSFTVAHSGTALYIDFFSRTNYLRAEVYEDLGPVSQDSCVEFFVEPRAGGEYWNFEFNCIGTGVCPAPEASASDSAGAISLPGHRGGHSAGKRVDYRV